MESCDFWGVSVVVSAYMLVVDDSPPFLFLRLFDLFFPVLGCVSDVTCSGGDSTYSLSSFDEFPL